VTKVGTGMQRVRVIVHMWALPLPCFVVGGLDSSGVWV
jgi:hypothetical protein